MRAILTNWDAQFYTEKELNPQNQVIVNKKDSLVYKKKNVSVVEGGLYSKDLGHIIDVDAEIRDCSCECQYLNGLYYLDRICPKCNTVVQKTYLPNLEKFGWIDLGNYHILTPEGYTLVSSIISPSKLEKIIKQDKDNLSVEGNVLKREKVSKSTMYENIGLVEFYRNFTEIIRFYGHQRKAAPEEIEQLIHWKNRLFASKIPVYSSALRPLLKSAEQTQYDPINKSYAKIATNAYLLRQTQNKLSSISVPSLLYSIQDSLNQLFQKVIKTKLSGKKRLTRGSVLGGKMAWSSRMVIIPYNSIESHSMDAIKISYKAFLELFTFEIENILIHGYSGFSHFNRMSPYQIITYVNNAKYSNIVYEDLYAVMKDLIKKHEDGLWTLTSRYPIFNIGSCQCLRIVDIFKSATSMVMAINSLNLESMNGDLSQSHLIA